MSLLNNCAFLPTAGGVGDFVVASALSGSLTPAFSGAVNGSIYSYSARSLDQTQWEVGRGAYSTTGPTLARTTVILSSNANAKVNFSTTPIVAIDALAEDFAPPASLFDTIALAQAATIPATINVVETRGYFAATDFGGAIYARVGSNPTHQGKFQSADGAWWEYQIDDVGVNAAAFGTKCDGTTDDVVAVQNAVDFALIKKLPVVVLPPARMYFGNTLHIGYGAVSSLAFTMTVRGQNSQVNNTTQAGTVIVCDKQDRQAINIQMGSRVKICDLTIYHTVNVAWWNAGVTAWTVPFYGVGVDPSVPLNYINPACTAPLGVHSPIAAITIDAFAGTAAADKYPTVTYPTWTGIGATQYSKGSTTEPIIERVEIQGFPVGIALGVNSDIGGDFLRIRDVTIRIAAYGIVVCNNQSRNVEIRNINCTNTHTLITNKTFGLAHGVLNGPVENLYAYRMYELFDLQFDLCGPLTFRNCYAEQTIRIGAIANNTFIHAALILEGLSFNDNSQITGYYPRALVDGTVPFVQSIRFVDCMIQGGSRLSNLVWGALAYTSIESGCSLSGGKFYMSFGDEGLAKATAWGGGYTLNGSATAPWAQNKVVGPNFANSPTPAVHNAISWAAGLVTAQCTLAHGRPIGSTQKISVAGVAPAAYNGRYLVTFTTTNQYTYGIASDPGTMTNLGGGYGFNNSPNACAWLPDELSFDIPALSYGFLREGVNSFHDITTFHNWTIAWRPGSGSTVVKTNLGQLAQIDDVVTFTYSHTLINTVMSEKSVAVGDIISDLNSGTILAITDVSGGWAKANASLTWAAGGIVTVTAAAPHRLLIGRIMSIIIAGAAPAAYNGTYTATIVDANTFTYPLAVDPTANTTVGTYQSVYCITAIQTNLRWEWPFKQAAGAVNISAMTWSAGTVTLTTSTPHGLAVGATPGIVIEGVSPRAFNTTNSGVARALVTGASTLTYPLVDNPGATVTTQGTWAVFQPLGGTAKTLSTLTWSGGVVTVTASAVHALEVGTVHTMIIAGATPAGYNGTFVCTILDTTRFTFSLTADPGGAASVPGTYTPPLVPTSGGTFRFWKTNYRIPATVYFGDFTAGSATVVNVHRGDNVGTAISQALLPGMMVNTENYNDASTRTSAVPTGTYIGTVTNGSPGSITLVDYNNVAKNATSTGRFPIMPVTISGTAIPQQTTPTVREVTANTSFTALDTDENIGLNPTTSASFTITLPLSSSRLGRPIMIADIKGFCAAFPVTVTMSGTDKCLGLASLTNIINADYKSVRFYPRATGGYFL